LRIRREAHWRAFLGGKVMRILEEFAIRLAWINFILSPKARFECSPDCQEDHTYLWPCRQRIKRPKQSSVGAYHDKNTPYLDLE
jgi:hypothetical protein